MDRKFKDIEEKVKKSLGIGKLPKYDLVVDEKLIERTAYNKKVGDKYIITISAEKDKKPNYSGFKHELIHLALKSYFYNGLEVNLPVPQKYEKDSKVTKFMECLTIIFEIKMGDTEKIKENLNIYQKYGFSQIKDFYKSAIEIIKDNNLDQKLINKLIVIKTKS